MKKYTKEQLLFYLQDFARKNNTSPTIRDFNKNKKKPCASTYSARFGSWNSALRKAGLKVNSKKYSKKELKENLKQLAKDLGRVPKTSNLKSKEWCASYSTYRKYFGSWKKALDSAGIKTTTDFRNLKDFLKR